MAHTPAPIPLAHINSTSAQMKPPFASGIIPVPSSPISPSRSAIPNGDATLQTAPLTPSDSLPTISGKANQCFLVIDDVDKFLQHDLDLSRLNKIHNLLWMAGRPMRARPLHRYKMMGHTIIYTQQMDLHLLMFSDKLVIKPLPEYLLDHDFWVKHICPSATGDPKHNEKRDALYKSAAGFLLSYIWLITSPLDLRLAQQDHYLIPSSITWPAWKAFVKDFLSHIDINALDQVNLRYHFGDLRLGRINSIYRTRYLHTHFVRGYLYGYNRYVVYFERNFSWILIVFVFFSVVLSAMQVGEGLWPLNEEAAFRRASYGFVVFSIVSVAVVLGTVGLQFGVVFLFNMVAAIKHDGKERRERKRLAEEKSGRAG